MHPQRRLGLFREDGSDGGGARSGPGGQGFPDSTLEKPDVDISSVHGICEFNVGSMLEVTVASHFGCHFLPAGSKFVHKDDVMRVSHRDWDAADFAKSQLDGEFIADLRLPHGDLELVPSIAAGNESADLQASAGTYYNFFSSLLGANIGGHATRSVAGNLRLGSVGIEQASLYVRILCGKQPLDAVSAYTVVAFANTSAERGQVGGGVDSV